MGIFGISRGAVGSSQEFPIVYDFLMPLQTSITSYTTSDNSSVTVTNTSVTQGSSTTINGQAVSGVATVTSGANNGIKLVGDIFKCTANQKFTLQFWIKKTSANGLELSIASTGITLGTQNFCTQTISGDRFRLVYDNSYSDSGSGQSLLQNNWYFITIVRSLDNSIKLYVNGTLYCTMSYPDSSVFNSEGQIQIPSDPNWRNNYNCIAGDICSIYWIKGVALSGTTVVNPRT